MESDHKRKCYKNVIREIWQINKFNHTMTIME